MDAQVDNARMLNAHARQIAECRAFLTRLWNLDNNERPGYLISYVGPRVKGGTTSENVLFVGEGQGAFRERLLDPERYL